jgi:hypothetical protein
VGVQEVRWDKGGTERGGDFNFLNGKGISWEFPEYHMKIILGDFNAKVGRKNIFKPTVGNESLCQDSNYIGVRIVNSAT